MRILLSTLLLLLCGCASGKLRCDGHLQPINHPAPAASGNSTTGPASDSPTPEARHD